jgi:hypothetical protein
MRHAEPLLLGGLRATRDLGYGILHKEHLLITKIIGISIKDGII